MSISKVSSKIPLEIINEILYLSALLNNNKKYLFYSSNSRKGEKKKWLTRGEKFNRYFSPLINIMTLRKETPSKKSRVSISSGADFVEATKIILKKQSYKNGIQIPQKSAFEFQLPNNKIGYAFLHIHEGYVEENGAYEYIWDDAIVSGSIHIKNIENNYDKSKVEGDYIVRLTTVGREIDDTQFIQFFTDCYSKMSLYDDDDYNYDDNNSDIDDDNNTNKIDYDYLNFDEEFVLFPNYTRIYLIANDVFFQIFQFLS
jgi:hypothetical protein